MSTGCWNYIFVLKEEKTRMVLTPSINVYVNEFSYYRSPHIVGSFAESLRTLRWKTKVELEAQLTCALMKFFGTSINLGCFNCMLMGTMISLGILVLGKRSLSVSPVVLLKKLLHALLQTRTRPQCLHALLVRGFRGEIENLSGLRLSNLLPSLSRCKSIL